MHCTRCGSLLQPTDRFCGKCGLPVAAAAGGAATPEPASTPPPISFGGQATTPSIARVAPRAAPHVHAGELRRLEGHAGRVQGVAFLPDGTCAITVGMDATARLWDLSGGREIRRFEVRFPGATLPLECVAVSPDGRLALLGGFGILALGEVESGREVRRFEGHEGTVNSVVFSYNGRYVLSGGSDTTLRLWEVESGREVRRFTGHRELVECVALSPDARQALSAGWDQTLRLWDVVAGRELRQIPNEIGGFMSTAFLPDGRHALSDDSDAKRSFASLWDLGTGEVSSVALSPDGRFALSASSDHTMRLWALPA